jgi:hypothetical protein
VHREQLKKAGIFRRGTIPSTAHSSYYIQAHFTGDSRYESVDSLKRTMIVTFENRKVDGTEKLQDSSAKVAGNAPAIKDFKMRKKNYVPIASAIAETRVVAEGSMAALTGIKSTDLDGDKLTFSWSQISGLKVELNSKHASDTAKSPNVEKIPH